MPCHSKRRRSTSSSARHTNGIASGPLEGWKPVDREAPAAEVVPALGHASADAGQLLEQRLARAARRVLADDPSGVLHRLVSPAAPQPSTMGTPHVCDLQTLVTAFYHPDSQACNPASQYSYLILTQLLRRQLGAIAVAVCFASRLT